MRPSPARRVAVLTVVVAAAVVALAWFTPLRVVLHTGLLAMCIFAFLPFVIVATLLAALFLAGIVIGIATEGGAHGSDLAGFAEALRYAPRGTRAYYSFLARQRHSSWVAAPAGLLLGTLIVWGLLAVFVVPHELRTTELLLRLQTEVEQHYVAHKDYPQPVGDERYPNAHGQPALDDFARPLHYEVHGKWRAKSYRITSLGADGEASSDDLCVQGQTKLQRALDTTAAFASFSEALLHFKTGAPVRDRLTTLRAVQCQHGALSAAPND
jgi:hypothetical protein